MKQKPQNSCYLSVNVGVYGDSELKKASDNLQK